MADGVVLPGTGVPVETQEQPDGSHRQVIALGEVESAALIAVLKQIANPMAFDPATGALRVFHAPSANGGAVTLQANQTLSVVTTVSTVTNLGTIGGLPANNLVNEAMQASWALTVRGRIT
jgi:hypothetical protein